MTNNDLEKRLWQAADQLRANSSLTAQDYILTLKRPAKTSGQISGQISWESTKGGLVEKLDIGLVENAWKVLEQIWKQPKITIKEIASNVGISTTTVDKHIAKLKKHKVLERIGGDKGGVWLIPEIEKTSDKSDE